MISIDPPVVLFLLAIILFGLCLLILHKVRRIHLMQYALQQQLEKNLPEHLHHTYQQIQAFIDLNRLLQLTYPLPPLRGWAASPDFLLLLAEHIFQKKPRFIVECSSGASTVVLAQCAKLNGYGQVLSLEHDAHYAEKTRQQLIKQGLEDWATVIDAPLINYEFNGQNYQWYKLNAQIENTCIDMLVVDGPPASLNHCARYPAGPLLLPLLNKEGVVFLDDADRPDEKEIIERWMEKFTGFLVYLYPCEKGAVVFLSSENI
ncbi:class I SAM-dependent methyltransferase [Nitrosomonas sp.]|uniref:class I SAM-dependent methyltransferase n=1 Tax=Nitrosomonas sp. TaxID=42353 RepID=UPI002626A938|nr:class I SAM-dependent methyltransferase [Nitrosomonas sp.]